MRVDDRDALERILRRDVELHTYELGDLDDFFFSKCTFFGEAEEIVLLYEGSDPPTLVALTRSPQGPMQSLLRAVLPVLPARVYAHLTPGLQSAIVPAFRPVGTVEQHLKMALRRRHLLPPPASVPFERLGPGAESEVLAFYAVAYPGTWFVPRMLETAAYLGARNAGRLVAVAGVHVLSAAQRVAALGNVATLPDHRGRGLARALCGQLCRDLLARVDTIGLNVAADNAPAIACYRCLGFEMVAPYDEALYERV